MKISSKKIRKHNTNNIGRFVFTEMQICPFNIENGYIRPERNSNYGYKLCVFDRETNIVVDVDLETKYEFMDVKSCFWLGNKDNKIKSGNRYAICPINVDFKNYSYKLLNKAEKIRKKLINEHVFEDGNIAFSNEEYIKAYNELNLQKKELIKNKG